MNKTIRFAIYARVSTEEQAVEGKTSIAEQLSKCEALGTSRGWILAGEFRDEGVSGTKLDRPQLDRLKAAASRGEFELVLVKAQDRLARDELVRLLIFKELREAGVRVVNLERPDEGETDEDELARGVFGLFAQYDRSKLVRRMAQGQHAVAARGKWPCSVTPFGYRHAKPGTDCALVVDPAQEQTIRAAYTWLVQDGKTLGQVCEQLNLRGWRPPRGGDWEHRNLRDKLRTRALVGELWWGRRTGRGRYSASTEGTRVEAPPILTETEWQTLQDALSRKARGPRRPDHIYPLSGRLRCFCSGSITGAWRQDRDLRQYRCYNAKWTAPGGTKTPPRCFARRLNADWAEAQVWASVVDLLADPARLLEPANDYLGLRSVEIGVEQEAQADLGARVAKLERAVSRATKQALLADDSERIELEKARRELQADLDRVRAQQAAQEAWRAEAASESARMRDVWALAEVARDRLTNPTPELMSEVLQLLDVRVSVLDDTSTLGPVRGGANGGVGPAEPRLRIEGSVPHAKLLDAISGGRCPEDDKLPPGGPLRR